MTFDYGSQPLQSARDLGSYLGTMYEQKPTGRKVIFDNKVADMPQYVKKTPKTETPPAEGEMVYMPRKTKEASS